MKLSNTSEYALRILSFMAKEPKMMYSAKLLIEKLNISDKYLRRLMTSLVKAGFINSIQGRDGGYIFNKSTNNIFLADIINAVEGMNKYTGCVLGFEKCSDENPCVMHQTWVSVRETFVNVFETKSLADLDFNDISKY
jgi:Rrf2 family protein